VRPGEGATRAANWGTTIGNIGGGVGGGKFGSGTQGVIDPGGQPHA